MKIYLKNILVLIIVLIPFLNNAQSNKEIKVLFVGNSYTFFGNLPQSLATLADLDGVKITTRQSTIGGATWEEHWKGERDLKTTSLIKNEKWDYVVLQNHSMSTLEWPQKFNDYGQKLIDLILENGAEPILYMTWSREYNPLMQGTVTKAYTALAKKNRIKVAPVGEAWREAKKLRPNLRLYYPDGSHPSILGTYLTACVFYKTITGNKVHDLLRDPVIKDSNGEKYYPFIIHENNAEFMKAVVDAMDVSEFDFSN